MASGYGWNGFHRLYTDVNGVKSRKRVLNIGAMCEFDQNGDTFFSLFLVNWSITSTKMIRNNMPEG